jgi:hypothetical protein
MLDISLNIEGICDLVRKPLIKTIRWTILRFVALTN